VYNTLLPQIQEISEKYEQIETQIREIVKSNIVPKEKSKRVNDVLKKYKVNLKVAISGFLPNYNGENIIVNKDSQSITIIYSGPEEIQLSTNVLPYRLSTDETEIEDITTQVESNAKPPKRRLLIPASIELLINILENHELARRAPQEASDIFRDNIFTHIANRVYAGLPPPVSEQEDEINSLSKNNIKSTLTRIWEKVQPDKKAADKEAEKIPGNNALSILQQPESSGDTDLAKYIINDLYASYQDELVKPSGQETPGSEDEEMLGGASDQHPIRLIRHTRNKSLTKNTDASNSHRCSCYPRKCEIGVCSRLSKKTHDNIAPETTQSLNNTKKRYRQHTLRNMRPLFPKNASNRKY
jgi:hypothetical protein